MSPLCWDISLLVLLTKTMEKVEKNLKRQLVGLVSYVEKLFHEDVREIIAAQNIDGNKIDYLVFLKDTVREKLTLIMKLYQNILDEEEDDEIFYKMMEESLDFEVKANYELKRIENFLQGNLSHVTKSPKLIASSTNDLNLKPKVLLFENCPETLRSPKIFDSVLKSVETETIEKVYFTNSEFLLHKEKEFTGRLKGDRLHENSSSSDSKQNIFYYKMNCEVRKEEKFRLVENKDIRISIIICYFKTVHCYRNGFIVCSLHYVETFIIEIKNGTESNEKIIDIYDNG